MEVYLFILQLVCSSIQVQLLQPIFSTCIEAPHVAPPDISLLNKHETGNEGKWFRMFKIPKPIFRHVHHVQLTEKPCYVNGNPNENLQGKIKPCIERKYDRPIAFSFLLLVHAKLASNEAKYYGGCVADICRPFMQCY